jgi:hypothetical protein
MKVFGTMSWGEIVEDCCNGWRSSSISAAMDAMPLTLPITAVGLILLVCS